MTRRYTDKEMGLIIQRALELPGEADGGHGSEAGISLEQIKEIAGEVGIEPHRIERAAASLSDLPSGPRNPYAGIPTTIQFAATLEDVEVSQISRHDLLDLIRRRLGRQGIIEEDRDSLEWKARDAFGGRYVSVAPAGPGTRIRLLGNFRDGLFVLLAAVGMGSFTGLSLLLDAFNMGSGTTLVAAALISMVPPRFAYRWWRRKEDATLAALFQDLQGFLASSGGAEALDAPKNEE